MKQEDNTIQNALKLSKRGKIPSRRKRKENYSTNLEIRTGSSRKVK